MRIALAQWGQFMREQLRPRRRSALLAGTVIMLIAVVIAASVWPLIPPASNGEIFNAGGAQNGPFPRWSDALWPILSLLFVLGLFYGAVYVYREICNRSLSQAGPSTSLRVLSSARLAPNQTLHVVSFGSKILLIGSSPNGMSVLEKESAPFLPTSPAAGQFDSLLRNELDLRPGSATEGETGL